MVHPGAEVMRSLLSFITRFSPSTIVIENVMGMVDVPHGADLSPLDLLVLDLRRLGYNVDVHYLDLGIWCTAMRPRQV